MEDAAHNQLVKRVISSGSVSDTTPAVGQIIDRQGFDSLTYFIDIGSVADADATFTVLLEEGDDPITNTGGDVVDLSDAAAVDDTDMISQTPGTAPEAAASFRYDSDNQVRKLGYIGNKRYTRLTVTPASNGSAAAFGAIAVLEDPSVAPVTQSAS